MQRNKVVLNLIEKVISHFLMGIGIDDVIGVDTKAHLLASFRAASCSSVTSIASTGNWTYLTTDPLTKQFFTLSMYGNFY